MLRVVATTHEQTPPIPKPHLNPRVACRARRGHQFHFHKFRRLVALQLSRRGYFPQALLPGEEMWRTQPAFVTKCSHALPTPHLLRNQLPPLRPHFLASLLSIHPATLLHTHSPLQDALQVALTIRFARDKGATQIFIGHSQRQGWWHRLRGNPVERLIHLAEGVDVRVFPQSGR
jgi:hypothetical protein